MDRQEVYKKKIIYRHSRVEANGWKRTGKYSGDSAKRQICHDSVSLSERLLNFSFLVFLKHGLFVEQITLSLTLSHHLRESFLGPGVQLRFYSFLHKAFYSHHSMKVVHFNN